MRVPDELLDALLAARAEMVRLRAPYRNAAQIQAENRAVWEFLGFAERLVPALVREVRELRALPSPAFMPGGAFCNCGMVEFMVPGCAKARTHDTNVPVLHTPVECRIATAEELSNLDPRAHPGGK